MQARNDESEVISLLEKLKYLSSEDLDALNEYVQNTIADRLNNDSLYLLMSSEEKKEDQENILKKIKDDLPILSDILFNVIAFVQAKKTKLDGNSYAGILERYQDSTIESFQKTLAEIETIFSPLTHTLTQIQIANDIKTFKEFIGNIPSKEQKKAKDIEKNIEILREACNDYKAHLVKETGYNSGEYLIVIDSLAKNVNEGLVNDLPTSQIIAYKKYYAMNMLLATLDDPKGKNQTPKTNNEKLEAFHAQLQSPEHKELIKQDRSPAARKFKNAMEKVFGEKIAEKVRLFFFGKTEGAKLNQKLEQMVSNSPKSK